MAEDISTLEKSRTACRMMLETPDWQQQNPQLVERLGKLFEGFVL